MTYKQISSTQNALIKHIVLLKEKSRERRKSGLFVVEGQREIDLALNGNYALETILFYPEIFNEEQLPKTSNETEIIEISKDVYQKIAHRETTEGIVAIAKSKSHDLSQLKLTTKNPLILIAEAPEKPGNIGALLRTADAANVDAFILANPKTDLYNPNIIRSSVGCAFTNQIATGNTEDIISFLKANNINIYSAILQDAQHYHQQDFTKASAIVVGTEADGLSQAWRDASTQNIIIPMSGKIDSMNVSVAAGILVFEAKRQRDFI
ncbi:TrmH family RNA methyltransferase [Mesoflavibacter sabulilitoris]|uniref:rRNA methyltransferase n=1 Tax=Mesoflavibacter zeaxanthinifaciens subsp. sabulilitoris TaxID=1520893 RepID=A0A2T1NPI5_9FLAO|nr:RNA methyltransferase [Mesoflavibacter zeaxanthinifaciens]MBB3125137.1 TrmH family RNA methyltransferase [Mesoflavibacter zeaxanthinifaciens subsp. sabulilitoris]PSG94812.1 rRNA methyltransferase [Mesoflavibacter zeaxanthinifaciens subsp. sabulilitoris]